MKPQGKLDAWLLKNPANTQAKIDGTVQAAPIVFEYDPEQLRISARAIGTEIGWLEVVDHGGDYWLEDIEVHPAYQRQGIGRAMMREAVAIFENDFRVPLLGQSSLHLYWLTGAGHALVIRCLNNRIITHAHTDHDPPGL